ncbi:dockerin type I domain-containing protein [Allorhodopirellula solitaria]|uniref:Dockerin type I repeat protein n=1 Tax=Allorhodopirellula solitaria TaxID=2527987 RepID=A0A5C5XVD2_9BACT|nr:dockerin type I domain-containing protein [Allorhodopirellula solitaria]TWT66363.1 Dockerin type I repeat protein [Allorhodopirellula solitaria]
MALFSADSAGTNGTDLSTLFRREPDLINGTLYLYPAVNATGTATLVFRADDGPDSRVDPNTKYQELTLNIDVGSRPVPEAPPIRTGTYNNPESSGVAIVDLNDVFLSTDGLDLSETVILTNGTGGVASINPTTGELEYRPNPDHLGEDIVIIEVQDNSGVKSGPVEVQFNTTRNRLTNPVIAEDVNRSGLVTSLDALIIINLLNEQENSDGVPIDSITEDDYYYDVSDNGFVTSLDAAISDLF